MTYKETRIFTKAIDGDITEGLVADAVKGSAIVISPPIGNTYSSLHLSPRETATIGAACFEPALTEMSTGASGDSLRNEVVGNALDISPKTARNHLFQAYEGMGCRGLAGAAIRAMYLGHDITGEYTERYVGVIIRDVAKLQELSNKRKQAALVAGLLALVNGETTRALAAEILFVAESTMANTLVRVYKELGHNAGITRASIAGLLAYTNFGELLPPDIKDALATGS